MAKLQNTTAEKIKILIVEDEASIAMDLRGILEESGYLVCDIAYSYFQAMDLVEKEKPDLVFLDIALKGKKSGLDVAREIDANYKIPFIFLTSFSDQVTIEKAVGLKPSGYLVKPFKEKDILPAVALALSNQVTASSKQALSFDRLNAKLSAGLSRQEYKVLELLCQGNTNKAIAELLFLSPNTIKTHLYKIYQKLDTNTRASTISKVMNLMLD